MANYVETMRKTAGKAYDSIYEDVSRLVFVDFPDYPNVGDSAIALGQFAYYRSRGLVVERCYCIGTLTPKVLESQIPVVINGGGNIAGFFDGIDAHRNDISSRLRGDTLLIQAPQSVHFATESAKKKFTEYFASRPALRMAVRDQQAVDALKGIIEDPLLAPDAVHHLGRIEAADPSQRVVILKRKDKESASKADLESSVDWLRDSASLRIGAFLRWKGKYVGRGAELLNLSPGGWERVAKRRLARGIQILAPGEVVITDRLHAMLIALQMGRRVIAVDNANQKLSKYANTWFQSAQPDITFASSFEQAMQLARK
ncbi:polysaccharide pyruvyl transferase family protein [Arthrobacter sp. EH-1B-1]|uniref:Polysaccharide pyruvyl transferase family protein n=1 Tax=Arthrobacter vasquezii TaxID=2977629 RepID=A0ABT6CXB5_9MICC|nr:polysaccharide pyruvyl transferase family protein [Arthrobacter vasquezii]MDF9278733.1 polysaccharide pyruvyl transferase family protein [Arthrobacter vasquezii]